VCFVIEIRERCQWFRKFCKFSTFIEASPPSNSANSYVVEAIEEALLVMVSFNFTPAHFLLH